MKLKIKIPATEPQFKRMEDSFKEMISYQYPDFEKEIVRIEQTEDPDIEVSECEDYNKTILKIKFLKPEEPEFLNAYANMILYNFEKFIKEYSGGNNDLFATFLLPCKNIQDKCTVDILNKDCDSKPFVDFLNSLISKIETGSEIVYQAEYEEYLANNNLQLFVKMKSENEGEYKVSYSNNKGKSTEYKVYNTETEKISFLEFLKGLHEELKKF
jgi:hypothetical protein